MKKKLENPILAEGEHTGYAHVLDTINVDVFEVGNGTREFQAMKTIPIKHPEHSVVICPPSPTGDYLSGIVQETDPFEEEIRNVKD